MEIDELKVNCPDLLSRYFHGRWDGRCFLCGSDDVEQSEKFWCEHEGKTGKFSYVTCQECGYRFPIKHVIGHSATNYNTATVWLDANTACAV